MRKPAGTGFCCAMISFTLATALAVRLIGAFLVTSGMVVVAIRISLALKLLGYYSRAFPTCRTQSKAVAFIYSIWMRISRGKSHCSDSVTSAFQSDEIIAGDLPTGL